MDEIEKIILTCPACGKTFQCKAPLSPGNYSVACVNPECKAKVSFHYPLVSKSQEKPSEEVKYGLLDDGRYRFRCENTGCRQIVVVPSKFVKIGHNQVKCPKCSSDYEFDVQPTERHLLQCQTDGCKGVLKKPEGGDNTYPSVCEECGVKYAVKIQGGAVVDVKMLTLLPPAPLRKFDLELVLGSFLGKKKYPLLKGSHYVGRGDDKNKSNFEIKDKYASSRSVRIDVNDNGGSFVYKLTVERAMNPVYHNNKELSVGDIAYLYCGDTIKLGKTLIKVQKIPKSS